MYKRQGRIAVGELRPDISERERAEDRVHHRVGEHVRIRMSEQSLFPGDLHPADHQPASFREPVRVVAVPDSHAAHMRSPSAASTIAVATTRSTGVVILMLS